MADAPTSRCRRCGGPLRRSALGELCPRCLLESGIDGDEPTADSSSDPFSAQSERPQFSRLGHYELTEELARGGMGVVYRARDTALRREVAVKILHAGPFASQAAIRRFFTEAHAAARLSHPHIVPIHEVGDEESQPYLVMPLVEGGSLAARLKRGPLSPVLAAALTAVVARAVHHAHQRGVLHRDLKPGNILLDRDARPMVTDFGLARIADDESSLTCSAAILGTAAYMAPDQSAGRSHDVTAVSDIWSLGAILYECLTGRPPFVAESVAATLRKVVEEEVPVEPLRLGAASAGASGVSWDKAFEKDSATSAPRYSQSLRRR